MIHGERSETSTRSVYSRAATDRYASNPGIAARYVGWLGRGIHVITPNKIANTGDPASYEQLVRGGGSTQYLYETTVGAGLPVIQTLRDLIRTGDEVSSIEGILSGQLVPSVRNRAVGRESSAAVERRGFPRKHANATYIVI